MADPHVISALRAKRGEVAGLIFDLERQIAQCRADLVHLDSVLRLYQPERDPTEIRPKRSVQREPVLGRWSGWGASNSAGWRCRSTRTPAPTWGIMSRSTFVPDQLCCSWFTAQIIPIWIIAADNSQSSIWRPTCIGSSRGPKPRVGAGRSRCRMPGPRTRNSGRASTSWIRSNGMRSRRVNLVRWRHVRYLRERSGADQRSMSDDKTPRSWFQTLPGILTTLTGTLTALAGLIVALPPLLEIFNKNKPPAHHSQNCISGYVWRLANLEDRVCMRADAHLRALQDNQLAGSRRDPHGGPYGADTCLSGFVFRDAFPGDRVCVQPDTRYQAAADNEAGPTRISRWTR